MEEFLDVQRRQGVGKRRAKRLRNSGYVPAILYGHGEEVVSLTVETDAFRTALRHGSKLVKLKGAVTGNALIRELQWDPFGSEVMHVDFMRVRADQRIEVEIAVELRGEAPGVKEGGIVEQVTREVKIEVLATAIPDKLHVNINDLGLEQTRTANQIEDLPAEAVLTSNPEAIIVQCVLPVEEAEEVEVGDAAEPELIGGKTDEETGEKS